MANKIVFLVSILVGSFAVAGPKIKQIDNNKDRVAVSATKSTQVGTQWMVTTSQGTQCNLEVTDTIGNMAILDADGCNLSQVKVGQRIQKSLFTSSAKGKVSTGSSSRPPWMKRLKGFSLIGYYSLSDDLPVKANGGTSTVEAEKAFGFGAEYQYDLTKWTQGLPVALVSGLTYELSRNLKGQLDGASFSLWTGYVNGLYNFTDSIGAFAGLNYSFPFQKGLQNDLKSQIGYQLGVTGSLTDNISVDGMYRWINMTTSGVSEISLDGLTIRGRYVF